MTTETTPPPLDLAALRALLDGPFDSLIPVHRTDLLGMVGELETKREACRTFGQVIKSLGDIAIEATDSREVIGEDGDGDWDVVWDRVTELGDNVRRARASAKASREKASAVSAWFDSIPPAGGDSTMFEDTDPETVFTVTMSVRDAVGTLEDGLMNDLGSSSRGLAEDLWGLIVDGATAHDLTTENANLKAGFKSFMKQFDVVIDERNALTARAEAAEAKVARAEALVERYDRHDQPRSVHRFSVASALRAALDGAA